MAAGKSVTITHGAPQRVKGEFILLLQDAETGRVEKIVSAQNKVTNDGAEYYAKRAALVSSASSGFYTFSKGKIALASSYKSNESATATIGFMTFGGGTTGIQSFDSGYPTVSDSDTDNTGSGVRVVTYRRTYTTAQGNFTIKALGIVRNGWITNQAGQASLRKILNFVTLAASEQITKTSSQTLKVFCNHTFAG